MPYKDVLPCLIPDCTGRRFARDWCSSHYHRWQRYGDPLAGKRPYRNEPIEKRFGDRYVVRSDGCWGWTGGIHHTGYGMFSWGGRWELAHRVSYRLHTGQMPPEIDHLCRNKACVNPGHLEAVTHSENLRRHYALTVTACPHGHVYDEANTVVWRGVRKCRECRRRFLRKRAVEA